MFNYKIREELVDLVDYEKAIIVKLWWLKIMTFEKKKKDNQIEKKRWKFVAPQKEELFKKKKRKRKVNYWGKKGQKRGSIDLMLWKNRHTNSWLIQRNNFWSITWNMVPRYAHAFPRKMNQIYVLESRVNWPYP